MVVKPHTQRTTTFTAAPTFTNIYEDLMIYEPQQNLTSGQAAVTLTLAILKVVLDAVEEFAVPARFEAPVGNELPCPT